MPNAVVMTGYGPPEVLKWAGVPLTEPGPGQIRIKVRAAGTSPTDLALRAGYLKAIPLAPDAVLGFEAAGTVDAVGPGVSGTSVGDSVTTLLFSLGGYAEYAVASIWTRKPATVSWIDAAALPSSAEAAVGVLRQLSVTSGETVRPLVPRMSQVKVQPDWPLPFSARSRTMRSRPRQGCG
jgi:NADPH:quinone reductase-like Zn-dependent oxidoreductase